LRNIFFGVIVGAVNKALTSTEAADRLGISAARVRRLVLDGRLPAQKFGRDLVIYESDVEAFERLKAGRPPKAEAAPVAMKRKRTRKVA
jgi:excisionase family DNA binding protein